MQTQLKSTGRLSSKASHHHLQDTLQILAFTDGARDLVEQVKARQLGLRFFRRQFALGNVEEKDGDFSGFPGHPTRNARTS